MLQKLFIQNYAIIDSLTIDFGPGLNIITGETGAGKSILAGALGLVLGNRADISVLFDKEKKCIVEAVFHGAAMGHTTDWLTANELDPGAELVIRRELSAQGKSRAFVNDTPVNLSQLVSLAGHLVDMHRQFDTLELGEQDFQLQVIDALTANGALLKQYRDLFRAFQSTRKELESMKAEQSAAQREFDYNQFLLDELEAANFKDNELEELDAELKMLGHAEQIKSSLDAVLFTMEESDAPLVQQLKTIIQQLNPLLPYHASLAALQERLRSAQVELQDIAGDLERVNAGVQMDGKRMNEVGERIATGQKLLKKHNVQATSQLLKIQENLTSRQSKTLHLGEDITMKEAELSKLNDQCLGSAQELSQRRKKVVPSFCEKVEKLLKQVGMPNARFGVEMKLTELGNDGVDEIEFMFDANKSNRFEPLRKVASGGELSRLMLCIQSLVAGTMQMPTLIFDEIDTGISGEAARQVGALMKKLSRDHQIISITHQPQIAAMAVAHYWVYKKELKGQVRTQIKLLDREERVDAIARMLGGENPTDKARANAREMVGGEIQGKP